MDFSKLSPNYSEIVEKRETHGKISKGKRARLLKSSPPGQIKLSADEKAVIISLGTRKAQVGKMSAFENNVHAAYIAKEIAGHSVDEEVSSTVLAGRGRIENSREKVLTNRKGELFPPGDAGKTGVIPIFHSFRPNKRVHRSNFQMFSASIRLVTIREAREARCYNGSKRKPAV